MDVFPRDHDMAQVLSGVGGLHYIIIFHYVTVYCGFCLEMTQTDSTSIVYMHRILRKYELYARWGPRCPDSSLHMTIMTTHRSSNRTAGAWKTWIWQLMTRQGP